MKPLCVVACLFGLALAGPLSYDDLVVHESRDDLFTSKWEKREALAGDSRITLQIGLKQRNLENGMDYLMAVSNPDSPSYGKHYTSDQVIDLFAPGDDTIGAVKNWLLESGIPAKAISVPKSKAWVHVDATIETLERLLQTKYHVLAPTRRAENEQLSHELMGVEEYSLPRSISDVVDFILPGVVPSRIRKRTQGTPLPPAAAASKFQPLAEDTSTRVTANPESLANCSTAVSPACIKAMYSIPNATTWQTGNVMGFYELDNAATGEYERYNQTDLDSFYKLAAPWIPKGTGPTSHFIDTMAKIPSNQSASTSESDLDLQMAIPIVYPQKTEIFQVGVKNSGLFNTFLDAIDGSYCNYSAFGETGDDPTIDGVTPNEACGTVKASKVISISYSQQEADFPAYYSKRQCNEWMKLGLQGVSVFFASGDFGVAPAGSSTCLGKNGTIFAPTLSPSCPYVTAVGATTLPPGTQPGAAEIASTDFSSGGGFSNIFEAPSYQKAAVQNYLTKYKPTYKSYATQNGTLPEDGGIFNRAGRGYPDLSAVGQNGLTVVSGQKGTIFGTSMATPIIGAMFTRINEERTKSGKGPVGFVNPVLYKHPEMFHDVTKGSQPLGGMIWYFPSACGNTGFNATKGWDPVTGLGTPNYPAMLNVFMSY